MAVLVLIVPVAATALLLLLQRVEEWMVSQDVPSRETMNGRD